MNRLLNIGLSENIINQINSVFIKYPEIEKVILYGSRAKGNYKEGSDIDLTMYGISLNYLLQMNIADELDELLLPYMIDLSIYNKLTNKELQEHINRVGIIFYEKNKSIK